MGKGVQCNCLKPSYLSAREAALPTPPCATPLCEQTKSPIRPALMSQPACLPACHPPTWPGCIHLHLCFVPTNLKALWLQQNKISDDDDGDGDEPLLTRHVTRNRTRSRTRTCAASASRVVATKAMERSPSPALHPLAYNMCILISLECFHQHTRQDGATTWTCHLQRL